MTRRTISPAVWPVAVLLLLALVLAPSGRAADSSESAYQMPPEPVAEIVDAPWTPHVSVSPDREWMLLMQYPGLPGIGEVSQPELRLAGIRINPRTSGPSRGWFLTDLKLRTLSDPAELEISGLPENPHITGVQWAPDSKHIAFLHTADTTIELWVIDVKERAARRLSPLPINDAYGSAYDWLSDSKTLVGKLVIDTRSLPPEKDLVPEGPIVQENLGGKTPARTYQDLLTNQHDEDLFEYHTTSQLALFDLDGTVTKIGRQGIIETAAPSPNGEFLLVEMVHRPYSYAVPVYRFPRSIEVWDLKGNVVHQVADLPLAEAVPIAFGSVPTGPRSVNWRADTDATLYWVEALDEGDAGKDVEKRDRLFMLPAPFEADPTPLLDLNVRFSSVMWGNDDLALAYGWWWSTRTVRGWRVYPGRPEMEAELIMDRSWEDRYNDPGEPVTRRTDRGTSVLATADGGNSIFLIGEGASPEGDRPFVDQFDLTTKETTRLFRSEAPYYEQPIDFLDVEKRLLFTRRESVDEPPNYFIRDLKHEDIRQLTFFPHPTPQLKDVTKELVRYEREDGVQLSGTLYLPPGYDPETDGPLPMLMWAYPQEFKSADAAGQVTDSPYRFVQVAWYSPMVWLAAGYAVLDDPTMPIVGEGEEEPNDTYIEQLVSSARAAVDEMVRRGVTSPDMIAIGGHSYGAFMTANLLAHSDLFAAGIARSGAYNRTLTPFGFQSEERTVWEAPEVYFAMSPFLHADKVDEPILLIHGEADNNSGTFPLQSERFYGALKGLGGTVRLVMLPNESHGYRARESVMHVLWEMWNWMETYVAADDVSPD